MTELRRGAFRERLRGALTRAKAQGSLDPRELESLLVDPEFDDETFEAFRSDVARAGVAWPDDATDQTSDDTSDAVPTETDRDLLDVYLREIGRVPMVSHERLLQLAVQARGGDEAARRHIILANLRLVVHLARGYRNRGLPMLDLIEEGNLGLIHAVDRFEPERGLRFSTYASIWIRQSILRGLAEQSRSIRIPVQMFQQMSRYLRAERQVRMREGRDPRIDEIARELGISLQRVERLSALVGGLRSLDEASSMEAFEQLSADALVEAPPSVERLVELQLEHERVDRLLRSLSHREEHVLRIRYGFLDGVARTLAQTGAHFGITRERVRQIEARALEKLRRALELEQMDHTAGTRVH